MNEWKKIRIGFSLFLFSAIFVICSVLAIDYEIKQTLKGYQSFQNIMNNAAIAAQVSTALSAVIIGVIDLIMLLSDWYSERQQKRIEKSKAEGIAEGENIAEQKFFDEFAEFMKERGDDAKLKDFVESYTSKNKKENDS
ncbi:MAG: hypothetical protein OXH39_12905 [Candidatus Poribacteria bacterium]|nr:hypothetical protein [Candidatus Poribacteria bacterium]